MNDQGASRWVVGVDGSAVSRHALRWALAHSAHRPVTVTAICCWAPPEGSPDHPQPGNELLAIELHLDGLRSALGAGASNLQTLAAHGHPSSELVHHATHVALLVLGTTGASGLQRALLGSVSLHVATHAPIPVAIIPPSAALTGRLDRIVAGIDRTSNSRAALAWALGFAGPATSIEAVGAWQPPARRMRPGATRCSVSPDSSHEALDQTVREVVASTASPAASVTTTFLHANPADALLQHAANADLLVMGAHGRGAISAAILGSVTNTVLHQAPCPIVVVPDP